MKNQPFLRQKNPQKWVPICENFGKNSQISRFLRAKNPYNYMGRGFRQRAGQQPFKFLNFEICIFFRTDLPGSMNFPYLVRIPFKIREYDFFLKNTIFFSKIVLFTKIERLHAIQISQRLNISSLESLVRWLLNVYCP